MQLVWKMLTAMGVMEREKKTAAWRLGEAVEKVSCWIWNRREGGVELETEEDR